MLVGHNPAMQDLALMLVGDGDGPDLERMRRKLPTGALVTLGFTGSWSELYPGAAELESMVRPKDL